MARKNIAEAIKKPAPEAPAPIVRVNEIEHWPIAKLKPWKRNAKNHPPEQITYLAELIRKHGFDVPIVVDAKGCIVKGHGRWMAAKSLGMVNVPVIVRADLSPTEIVEARIADNRSAEFGWNFDALIADVVEGLKHGLDTNIIGWTLKDLGLDGRVDEENKTVRGEWEPDFGKIDKMEESGDAPDAVLKIVCPASIAPKLREVLQRCLDETGYSQAKLQ